MLLALRFRIPGVGRDGGSLVAFSIVSTMMQNSLGAFGKGMLNILCSDEHQKDRCDHIEAALAVEVYTRDVAKEAVAISNHHVVLSTCLSKLKTHPAP